MFVAVLNHASHGKPGHYQIQLVSQKKDCAVAVFDGAASVFERGVLQRSARPKHQPSLSGYAEMLDESVFSQLLGQFVSPRSSYALSEQLNVSICLADFKSG